MGPPKRSEHQNFKQKRYFEHAFCIISIGQNPSTPQKKGAPKVKESSNPYSSVTTFKRRTGQADSLVHPGCGEWRSALPACARGAPKISRVCLFSKYWSKSPKTPKSEHQIKKKYFEHALGIVFTGKNPPTPQPKVSNKNDSNTSQTMTLTVCPVGRVT